jgi:transposase
MKLKGRRTPMRKIKEILRLHFEHQQGMRAIARACQMSPTTVSDYIAKAQQAGLNAQGIGALTDEALGLLFFPETPTSSPKKAAMDFPALQKELQKKGVTLQLLWEEYKAIHPEGYGRSQFFQNYRDFAKTLHPVMRLEHKAGDKLFVDFSGDRPTYVDKATGEIITVELFVAVLGASSRTFAVAVPDQKIPSWIKAHILAFEDYGGLPAIVVPDNLRAGVKSACLYDPALNPVYAELAAHYQVAVLPARAYKPRDKAKAENGVLHVQRRILAALRHHTFFSLSELNAAIAGELVKLNAKPMQSVGKSRQELFAEIDQPALKPLPLTRFDIFAWKMAKVGIDYHIAVEHNFYSVPYALIHKEVEVRLTGACVEILHGGQRVASHPRSYGKGGFSTLDEHRPHEHKKYLEWTPERMRQWGLSIGTHTAMLMEKIIAAQLQPEHGFRRCLGILRLAKTYSPERLERACQMALHLGTMRYRNIKSILEKKLEQTEASELDPLSDEPLAHHNIRGSNYYAGGLQ